MKTETTTETEMELTIESPSKWTEREWLLTIALLIGIVADAVFGLGIDIEHWAGMIGASAPFAISRGLAKRGAAQALPYLERAQVAATVLQAADAGPEDPGS